MATLLAVTAGQFTYRRACGRFFVYQSNDLPHFVAHLGLASAWYGEAESFNGPAWSVSVEVLLYILFFALCLAGLTRWWHLASFVGLGLLTRSLDYRVGVGAASFFSGGLAFLAADRVRRAGLPSAFGSAIAFALLALVVAKVPVLGVGRILILFPVAIAALALAEHGRGSPLPGVAWLGQISYSAYLIHFPLQLVFVLAGLAIPDLAAGGNFYRSPASLALFFVALIPLSLASYWWFELPTQRAIRGLFGEDTRH